MLVEFRKLIVKALVGYIKMREGHIDHLDFGQGINLVVFDSTIFPVPAGVKVRSSFPTVVISGAAPDKVNVPAIV